MVSRNPGKVDFKVVEITIEDLENQVQKMFLGEYKAPDLPGGADFIYFNPAEREFGAINKNSKENYCLTIKDNNLIWKSLGIFPSLEVLG